MALAAGSARLPVIDVAATIVADPSGRILLAERKPNQLSPGFWELPGGKIEIGESAPEAAARELAEEVGVRAGGLRPWAAYEYAFPTKRVKLRFFRAETWDGTPHGREGQRVAWVDPAAPSVAPLLPSNERVLQALALPRRIALACGRSEGSQAVLLDNVRNAVRHGARLIVLRPPALSPDQRVAFARRVQSVAAAGHARVVLHGSALEAQRAGVAGALADAEDVRRLAARPALRLWGARCHAAEDVRQAVALGADFLLLGPVVAAPSGRHALGWPDFAAIAAAAPMPVWAYGSGLALADAQRAGAFGIVVNVDAIQQPEGFGGVW